MWRMPEKTEWAKEQNLHEPTRSYGEEIYDLQVKFEKKNALEIGCVWGVSTIALLTAGVEHLLSVDPIPQDHKSMHARREVEADGFSDRWSWYEGRSSEFWRSNKQNFDLIYIDGSHLYEDFRNDIFEAWEVLDNGGLLICDDITHKSNKTGEYGISVAAWEFIKEKRIERLHTTTRLLYIVKGEA